MSETKICPHCGGEILAVAKKCKHCGQWLDEDAPKPSQDLIRCPICDEEIPADSVVCPECGEPLPPKDVAPEVLPSEPPQKKSSKWWVPLLALLVIGGCIYYFLNDRDDKNDYTYSRSSSSSSVESVETTEQKPYIPAPTDEVLEQWDVAHNMKAIDKMGELYADTVYYYQSSYTLTKVLNSKQKLFDQNPLFHQESQNVRIVPVDNVSYKFEFDKNVWVDYSDDAYKTYPSYLIVTRIGSDWKITTESDTVTDANLAKRAKKNSAN